MRRIGLLLASALLVVSAAADERLVDLGGRRIRMRVEGSGPTVVFENGFTSSLEEWRLVLPEVAKFARVVAYDRAGVGKSDAATGERSYVAIADDLHALLQHEKIASPVVLVGHSYGGALIRVFAKLYAADVRGVVFVDPMSELALNRDPQRDAHVAEQEAGLANAPAGVRAEWAYLKRDLENRYARLLRYRIPNLPAALIVATIDRPSDWRATVMEEYGTPMLKRDDALIVITPDSGHVVPIDQPQVIISAIRSILFPNPLAVVSRAMASGGVDAAIARFHELIAQYPKGEVAPTVLNTLGYRLLGRQNRPADAVRIFALNVATFPDDANGYDSLGEAQLAAGDKSAALASYRKAFALDPANSRAQRIVQRLESEKQ